MMSESAKQIEASTLRSSDLLEDFNLSPAHADGRAGPGSGATEDGQECRGVPPVGSARTERIGALVRRSTIRADDSDGVLRREGRPRRFETLLQFKGFAGGVPQNTERTTVKPWVGIAR
jgi:hypothetical protein